MFNFDYVCHFQRYASVLETLVRIVTKLGQPNYPPKKRRVGNYLVRGPGYYISSIHNYLPTKFSLLLVIIYRCMCSGVIFSKMGASERLLPSDGNNHGQFRCELWVVAFLAMPPNTQQNLFGRQSSISSRQFSCDFSACDPLFITSQHTCQNDFVTIQ